MKNIMVFVTLAVVILISGCATQKEMVWVPTTKPVSDVDLYQDSYQCQLDAAAATGVFSTPENYRTNSTRRRNYEAIHSNCMRSKGYVLEDKERFSQKKKELTEMMSKRGFRIGVALSIADDVYAKILKVAEDSPAEKAGMKTGDVIKKVNGNDISSSVQFFRSDWGMKAGEPSTFVVTRDGFTRTFVVIPEKAD